MNNKIKKHKELHKSLDELVSCFINSTEKLISETSIMDLFMWSAKQTIDPDCTHIKNKRNK